MREKVSGWIGGAAGALFLCAASPAAFAIDERWSVSFGFGGLLPSLDALNDGLFDSPLLGTATILIREGGTGSGGGDDANETEVIPWRYDSPLPDVDIAPHGSIELMWHANERHAFIFGFGAMEAVATDRTRGSIPLQQYFASNIVDGERRGKISFTEYTLGWRYTILSRANFRLYGRLSLHEVYDIDYREDFVFLFTESPILDLVGVRRNMVVEAQTSSVFMGQIGLGGEWFLQDWLSVSLEGGYLVGESDFSLRDVEIRDDFQAGDSLSRTGMPFRRMPDGTLGYLLPGATVDELADPEVREGFYRPIRLGFDGWRAVVKLNIYF